MEREEYTMTDKIDVDTVLGVMEEIVAEFGADYVYTDHYESCQYVSDEGQPACIVGQVLARLDLPLPDLSGTANVQAWTGRDYNSAIAPFRQPFTDEANQVLRAAQAVQDGDHSSADTDYSWGHALELAKAQIA